jgi:hypothetical protein
MRDGGGEIFFIDVVMVTLIIQYCYYCTTDQG